jgi:hypothetical protein
VPRERYAVLAGTPERAVAQKGGSDKRGATEYFEKEAKFVEGDNIQKATVVVVGGGGGDRIMAMTATSDSLMEQG